MDLPLWDQSDGQDNNALSFYTEDHSLNGPSFVWRDVLREDALNEQCCIEVLKRLNSKADEDISKLEEDILILQCELAWDDEEWSRPCSTAMQERIDQLDILIQDLKNGTTEDFDGFYAELGGHGKLSPSLQDLVKPLLESYFLRIQQEQKDCSTVQSPIIPADGCSKEIMVADTSGLTGKVEAEKCSNPQKGNNRMSSTIDGMKRNINHPNQNSAAEKVVTEHSEENPSSNLTSEVCCKETAGKTPTETVLMPAEERKMGMSDEPSNTVKDLSKDNSIEKAGSGGRDESKATDMEAIAEAEFNLPVFAHESAVASSNLESQYTETKANKDDDDVIMYSSPYCVEQESGVSSKPQKIISYKPACNKDLVSRKPSVKAKRKNTKFPEKIEWREPQATETEDTDSGLLIESFNHKKGSAPASKTKTKTKIDHKLQGQPTGDMEAVIELSDSDSSLKPGGQGTKMKCKPLDVVVQNFCLSEDLDLESLLIEKLKGEKKIGVLRNIDKHGRKESPQEFSGTKIDDVFDVTTNSISSVEKKRKPSFSSKSTEKKSRIMLTKLIRLSSGTSGSTVEETTDSLGVDETPQNSSSYTKDGKKLSLNQLRAMAKQRNLSGYSKLRKDQLIKCLSDTMTWVEVQATETEDTGLGLLLESVDRKKERAPASQTKTKIDHKLQEQPTGNMEDVIEISSDSSLKSGGQGTENKCSTVEETRDNLGVDEPPLNSLSYIKDGKRLSLAELRAIAKQRGLPGYSKLRKVELVRGLGLEPPHLP